jgi:Tfp pilus assembly protein PilX
VQNPITIATPAQPVPAIHPATAAASQIAALKRTLNLLSRIAANLITTDYEDLDALHRALRDAHADLAELELELQPGTDEDAAEAIVICSRCGAEELADQVIRGECQTCAYYEALANSY